MIKRKKTRKIKVGQVSIGGDAPISIQSMTNTPTYDREKTIAQILSLEKSGCEIIRVAVPDQASAEAISDIKKEISIPIIADIHFDHKLAITALNNNVDGLRLNPGNIKKIEDIQKVVTLAKEKQTPIRVGVNAGSIDRSRYHSDDPNGLVESALQHIHILEEQKFENIKISLKSSNIETTIEAYRLMIQKRDYPLHIGITEAGTNFSGTIKSAIGLGILLYDGIGDTLRVSLSTSPEHEVKVAKQILRDLGLRKEGIEIISCPTCSRAELDIEKIANEIEIATSSIQSYLKVAIMGCIVNGPGEAKDADIGIAGNQKEGILFRKGKIIKRMPHSQIVPTLLFEIKLLNQEKINEK